MYDLFLEERLECFIVLKHDVVAEQVKVLERFRTLHLTMVSLQMINFEDHMYLVQYLF